MSDKNYTIPNGSFTVVNSYPGSEAVIKKYADFISEKQFPCIMAKAVLAKQHVRCMVAGHMGCPSENPAILNFLYQFVDEYRNAEDGFYSAVVIFKETTGIIEEHFDQLLWRRLQALSDMDAKSYRYDNRVDADPRSENFSFSLKEEAFYIIGLHPFSSRQARQFGHAAIVFNPHAQFEKLRQINKYDATRESIRKRDLAFSGSINPMLQDFGKSSEAFQYSGRAYDNQWQCPLNVKHAR